MNIKVKYDLNKNLLEFNSFEEIPNYDKIVYIVCSDNQLSSLPKLPNSLKELYCEDNQLTSLQELPNSLQTLYCGDNQLTSLLELPNSLQVLSCGNNPFIMKQENFIQKIIYSISQDKKYFIDNLFLEFGEICLECHQQFININKYKFPKWNNLDVVIKNSYCLRC